MTMLLKLSTYNDGKNHQRSQIAAILCASISGFSNGFLYAWTSPSIPILVEDESSKITLEEASYFTVLYAAAMLISAPFLSKLCDKVGRKNGILLLASCQLAAWILTASSQNLWNLYVARVIGGIAEALFYATAPVYVCEVAEPKVRGTWGTLVAVGIYFGVLMINVIGSYCPIRTTAIIGGSVNVIHILLFSFTPESPYYLLMKKRDDEALEALKWLRLRDDVEDELFELKRDVNRQMLEATTIKELFSSKSNKRALVMCLGIYLAQQLSGLSAFELHTQYMFQQAGTNLSEQTSAIIFAGALFSSITIASFFVESIGRKPLMFFSCLFCGVALTVETIYFGISDYSSVDVSHLGWIPLAGMIGYIIVCATGIALLPTLILGEVFATNFRSPATALMNIVTGTCLLVLPKLFQTLTENFGIFSPFCLFAICCYSGVAFSHFYVIETKGKTLEEIQQKFRRKSQTDPMECEFSEGFVDKFI